MNWPAAPGIDTSGIEPYIAGTSIAVSEVRGFHVGEVEDTAAALREDYPNLSNEQALDAAGYWIANRFAFFGWDDMHAPVAEQYWAGTR